MGKGEGERGEPWTDERIERLKQLHADGSTASQIADELGGITRSSICGKLWRLGLLGLSGPRRSKKFAAQSGGTSVKIRARREFKKREAAKETPTELPPEPALPPTCEPIGILQLNERTCRYPIGDPQDPAFAYCGAEPKPGFPYCPYHCDIAFDGIPQPRSREQREADKRRGPRTKDRGLKDDAYDIFT